VFAVRFGGGKMDETMRSARLRGSSRAQIHDELRRIPVEVALVKGKRIVRVEQLREPSRP
jgi:hypothetical protein